MRPFHFRDGDRPLLGVYHRPVGIPSRAVGVVLCYPVLDDYVGAHRAYRVFAERLARERFHVLRFDYYATGDSAGDRSEADLSQWLDDVNDAVDELRSSQGVLRVALAGLRLGGTLAALAAGTRDDVEGVALWHPVVTGTDYLDLLRARQDTWYSAQLEVRPALRRHSPDGQVLGTPIPDRLTSALVDVDLRGIEVAPSEEILVLSEKSDTDGPALVEHLRGLGANVEAAEAPAWTTDDWLGGLAEVPSATLNTMVTWLSGLCE